MMYAKKIRMTANSYGTNGLLEIDDIYIDGCNNPGYFSKEVLYDHLKKQPNSIKVNVNPYPSLIPALSQNGEKYVRSSPNQFNRDNLLSLPKE